MCALVSLCGWREGGGGEGERVGGWVGGREGGKGRKRKGRERERREERVEEAGWSPGSCFLPGRAAPSGGEGAGGRDFEA